MVKKIIKSKSRFGNWDTSSFLPLSKNETGGLFKEFLDNKGKYVWGSGGQLPQGFSLPNKKFGTDGSGITNQPRYFNKTCSKNSFGMHIKKHYSKKCKVNHKTKETKSKCKNCNYKKSSKKVTNKSIKPVTKKHRKLNGSKFGDFAKFDMNGTNTMNLQSISNGKYGELNPSNTYKSFGSECDKNGDVYPVFCMGKGHGSGFMHPGNSNQVLKRFKQYNL
jgi:hypothetical protein